MIFVVQFGLNKHLQIFSKTTILLVLEKIYNYLFIPNCRLQALGNLSAKFFPTSMKNRLSLSALLLSLTSSSSFAPFRVPILQGRCFPMASHTVFQKDLESLNLAIFPSDKRPLLYALALLPHFLHVYTWPRCLQSERNHHRLSVVCICC